MLTSPCVSSDLRPPRAASPARLAPSTSHSLLLSLPQLAHAHAQSPSSVVQPDKGPSAQTLKFKSKFTCSRLRACSCLACSSSALCFSCSCALCLSCSRCFSESKLTKQLVNICCGSIWIQKSIGNNSSSSSASDSPCSNV